MKDEQELEELEAAMQRWAEVFGPTNPVDWACRGGMHSIEKKAVAEALADAWREWLPRLEKWLAEAIAGEWTTDEPTSDLLMQSQLESAIRQIRIRLGIKVIDIEKRRQQTRERVRRFRAARKAIEAP